MWEKLKNLSQTRPAKLLLVLFGDPVQLYAVFLIMTAMYYYHQAWSWLYTLIALLLSFVLMRFYDFVAGKRLLGPVCYLIFLFLGLYSTGMLTNLGEQSYPISFAVWFLTPQSVVDFSLLYTIAIFMLMVGFLTSTVYYFSKVRYRMVMQLLIMLIPLSLYAKENLHMPALLVILLLASYFLLMIYCRQLRPNEETRQILGFPAGVSIGIYVTAFSVIAAIIPKPQFQADREFIDNAMSYSTWSDVLMSAISAFTETTDNTFAVSNNGRTIFYVDSPESLRLRTQTYTYYLEDDSWNVAYDDRPQLAYEEPLSYQPRALTQAILDAAALDSDFAEQYGLADLAGTALPPQELQEIYLFTWFSVNTPPSPTRTMEMTEGASDKRRLSYSKTIGMPLSRSGIGLSYYSDTYARYEAESEVLRRLEHDSYGELLEDAAWVLRSTDPQAASLLRTARMELADADTMLAVADAMSYHSETIDDLAAQLTEGLHSDFEKACAIERYFTEQNFVYDMAYTKEAGDNVDDFLTDSHTGVCYEYATAMTLLCRSAGLPARYVQGYNMSERYRSERSANGRETNFVIKVRDAHAFPEVYIAGYGWLSFEPTVAANEIAAGAAENQNVMRWGYILLGLCLLACGIWAVLPYIRERHFRRSLLHMPPRACASAIFIRMRRTLHMPDSATVRELSGRSAPFFTQPEMLSEMDALLYHPTEHPNMTAKQLAVTYIQWQAERKAYEKEQKKLRKEQKKAHVNV